MRKRPGPETGVNIAKLNMIHSPEPLMCFSDLRLIRCLIYGHTLISSTREYKALPEECIWLRRMRPGHLNAYTSIW
jgi:hypothetical protein